MLMLQAFVFQQNIISIYNKLKDSGLVEAINSLYNQ